MGAPQNAWFELIRANQFVLVPHNTEKSRVRARAEHVFGAMENDMVGIFLRSMGAARAKVGVDLMNLTYNLKRIETLIRLKVFDLDRMGAPVAQAMV